MEDILIIGAGPAGATLATYLARFGINSVVLNNQKTNLSLAHEIENYYGIDSISGTDLYQEGINKLTKLGVKVLSEEVVSIEYDFVTFKVKTTSNLYEAKILVLATGLAKKSSNIKNLALYEGKGVSYCATCDGFFFRNKRLGIVGSESFMEEELGVLSRITKDITIFTNGKPYEGDNAITDKIDYVYGNDKLEGIVVNGEEYPLDGLFIAEGSFNSFAIVKHLGIETNSKGEIVVDNNFLTNVPNCYAIGDMIPDIKQVTVASSHGLRLAYYLLNLKKEGNI